MSYDYYAPPTDEVFNEIAQKSKDLWRARYSDEFGYVTEKTSRIDSITNFKDNWGSIWGMFDSTNQALLYASLSDDAQAFVKQYIDEMERLMNEERA